MTAAEELRAAAVSLRRWHPATAPPLGEALADWLDGLAGDEFFADMSEDYACSCYAAGLSVARAFMGGAA